MGMLTSISLNGNFPVDGNGVNPMRVVCYVWRPSTQTKVGNILDGNSASNPTEPAAQRNILVTFSGAAVSSIQDGDVICYEVMFPITQAAATAYTDTIYFDGTTASTINNQTTSNQASFLETPQSLTFGEPPATTPVSQEIIMKYGILSKAAATSIIKYGILVKVAQTIIAKYKIAQAVRATSILLYSLAQTVCSTSMLRYPITQLATQSDTIRYAMTQLASKTNTFPYNIRQLATRLNTFLYNLYIKTGLKTNTIPYAITQLATNADTIKYNIRQLATNSDTLLYNIRKLVTQSDTLRYLITQIATNTDTIRYSIAQLTGQSVDIVRYAILSKATKSITSLYNIATTQLVAFNTLIAKYDVRQRVGGRPPIVFDGTDDYINCATETGLWSQTLSKFSFSIWVKLYSTIDVNTRIVDHNISANNGFGIYIPSNTSAIFRIRDNTGANKLGQNSSIPSMNDRWVHLVGVFDNSLASQNVKIYVDTVLGSTQDTFTGTINLSAILSIGSFFQQADTIKGEARDFRWFNAKALTQAEVTAIYENSAAAPTPNYWLKMDEGYSNSVDSITGTKIGILTNGAYWQNPSPEQIHKYGILKLAGDTNSLNLPGTTALINLGTETGLWSQAKSKFSFSLWFKPSIFSTGAFQNFINHGWQNTGSFLVYLNNTNSAIVFAIRDSVGQKTTTYTIPAGLVNTWIHLVGTFDNSLAGGDVKTYINGVLQGSVSGDVTETLAYNLNLVLGGTSASLQAGQMKDWRWWNNVALTASDVTKVYNNAPDAPAPNYWLKMNEGTGNPVDSISGTKTGTVTNATWINQSPSPQWTGSNSIQQYGIRKIVGYDSMVYDGLDDVLTIPNRAAINNLDDFTISLWVYLFAGLNTPSTPHLFNKLYPTNNGFLLYFSGGASTPYVVNLRVVNDTGTFTTSTTNYIQTTGPNRWYHILVTFVRSTKLQSIYIDGVLRDSDTVTGTISANLSGGTANMTLNGGSAPNKWAGFTKDFRLWRSALTQTDIDKVYANASNAPTPDAWYKMNEGTGSPNDTITPPNPMTITGGMVWGSAIPTAWANTTGRTFIYSLRQVATSIGIHLYSIRQLIASTSILRYGIRTLIAKANTLRYAIRLKVTKSNTHLYNILQTILQVNRTLIARYAMTQKATQSQTHRYLIRMLTGMKLNTFKYGILIKTGHITKTMKYEILGFVTQSTNHLYGILTKVQKQIGLRYGIRTLIGRTITHRYGIAKTIASTLIARYKIVTETLMDMGDDVTEYIYKSWSISDPNKEDIS